MLNEFYAVTFNSMYRVSTEIWEQNWPTVEKLDNRKEESDFPIGAKCKNGDLIAVTRIGLVMYPSYRQKTIEQINTYYCGGKTSPIVGLFLDKEKAEIAFKADSQIRLGPQWEKETKETLAAIGADHPIFIIHTWYDMAFPESFGLDEPWREMYSKSK